MPAAQQSYYNFVAATVNVVTTAETVIATTRSVSSSYAGCVFSVKSMFDFLTGAAASAVTFRIRRDSLTGTAIFTSPAIAVAASTQLPRTIVAATDAPAGEVAGQLYVVTVAQTAATGNGTAQNAFTEITVAE